VDRLVEDLRSFQARHDLVRVVVVNVASTEPPVATLPEHADLDALGRALADPGWRCCHRVGLLRMPLCGLGVVLLTSPRPRGARLPALVELAYQQRLPLAGSDGKTGETLVKSVLAPRFAARALRVWSWAGINLLGGDDGATLGDPAFASSKLESKGRGVTALLGEGVVAPLHIDNVPDLGNWKTAWDHISFVGFLGVRMTLQFTWTGCDSALAGPLVLGLARLTAAAHAAGHGGVLPELAFFFKDPMTAGTPVPHGLADQARELCRWAATLPQVSR
jgi:myo-inositol-1-phosphate synthase